MFLNKEQRRFLKELSKEQQEIIINYQNDFLESYSKSPPVLRDEGPERTPTVSIHGNPCRLVCTIPPRETGSWISGTPSLPKDVDWPVFCGEHLTFLAQIRLRDVPRTTWGGLHPEEGWFVIFYWKGNEKYLPHVRLLHTLELGSPRLTPHQYDASFDLGRSYGYYNYKTDAFGPSRWPVEITSSSSSQAPTEQNIIRNSVHNDLQIGQSGWQPFDERTMAALYDAITKNLQNNIRNLERTSGTYERPGSLDVSASLISECKARAAQIKGRQVSYGKNPNFTQEKVTTEVATLSQLTYPCRYGDGSFSNVSVCTNETFRDYGKIHEYSARQIYLDDHRRLRSDVLKIYEPIWKEAANSTFGHIGGQPNSTMQSHDDRGIKILEIPTSVLFGLQFGDVSNLSVSISKEDFATQNWDICNANDSHGY